MEMQTRQIATNPATQDAPGGESPVSSLLNLQIRRRRPANAGWAVSGQARETGRDRPAAKPAPPVARPAAPAAPNQAASVPVVPDLPGAEPRPAASRSGDIFAYWRDHRDGRRFPAWSDFDPDEILSLWPNSVLLACGEDLGQPRLAASFTEALRAAKRKEAESLGPNVEYTPLLTEWLLSLGKEVARLGKPLNDSESLPALKGRVRYRVVGLPLGESPLEVDHVLCHVARA